MASSSSTECAICCETFNQSTRKKVVCAACHFETCTSCVKHYLLDTSDPHCMSCKHPWNDDYLHTNMTKVFMNQDLKKHREKMMMDREIMLLPDTQVYVEKELEMRKLDEDQKTLEDEILKADRELRKLRRKHMSNQNKIFHWNVHHDLTYLQSEDERQRQREAPKFVRACPANDCRGFLSSQWKCGLCNVKVCKECHEIKDESNGDEHICLESNVETARQLMKDTKPCPGCSSMIFKISGCDQMWCTQCHTAFSWRTGNIERNIVHNPHFYEWQRTNNGGVAPRVPGDVVCGGLVTLQELNRALYHYHPNMYSISADNESMKPINEIRSYHRLVGHVQEIELLAYRARTNEDRRKGNVAMRIKWMLNEIEEKTWKHNLYTQEKRDKFRKDIYDVFDLFSNAGQDILRRVIEEPRRLNELLLEMDKLVEYVNNSFRKISKQNKYSSPHISKTLRQTTREQWVVSKKVW